MAEEIQEAVQIIRVGYDGIEIAMKVCGGTIEGMKKAVDFLIAVMDHEKTMGKTDMRRLLMKGGDLQVLQFPTEDMKKVEKLAKKYGLLYSVLPDINKKDGMSEIIFHTEAVPRVNMMIQKLKSGRIVLVHVEDGGEVGFEGIAEYDSSELILNLSDRYGTLTEEMKDMGIDDVFYHDDFANDGGLVSLEEDSELTLYEQIDYEVNLSAFHCYLCSGKNMGDVSKLPAGSYLMIDCGETMRKVREALM